MKKLFVQFYLLLFVCFLVMTMLVGLVYKFTAERAGRQSLDDLMKSSLYLMRSELREIPPRDWSKTLKELDLNLSFDLHIEPMSKFKLSESSMQHLRAGDIVALDDQYTFIQRIPRSTGRTCCALKPLPSALARATSASAFILTACPALNGSAWPLTRWPITLTPSLPVRSS